MEPSIYILHIDDDQSILNAFARAYRIYEGWAAMTVDNFNDAIDALNDVPHSIDIVVCDYQLAGGKTGIDVLNWIKENRP